MAHTWRAWTLSLTAAGALALALGARGGAQGGPPPDPSTFPPGDAARGSAKAASGCAGCHGVGGVSDNPEFPRLAGQQASYLAFQLVVLRAGIRPAGIMNKIAAGLSDQDITDLTAYFSAEAIGPAWPSQDEALVKQGQALFMAGDVKRRVTACAVCHGNQGLGVNELGVAAIRHQTPAYLVDVLTEYKTTPDFGVPVANAMHNVAAPLEDGELKALAAYLSTMP